MDEIVLNGEKYVKVKKKDFDCSKQKVERNMYCNSQKVEGDMDCHYQEVEGNMNCSYQEVEGKLFIAGMKVGKNKKVNDLIKKYSEKHDSLDFETFVLELIKKDKVKDK